jgi:4-aminobutyrate aminotransferase
MFAVEHTRTVPDVMTLAKALGNGLPVAAILARHAVMRHWQRGEHGTTFGGNPVACAAMLAVIDVMNRERVPERAARLGKGVIQRAQAWRSRAPALADVRGLGLMIGLEFMRDGRPDAAAVRRIRARALADGLLTLSCGTDDNVIRVMPPLTIPEAELDAGLDILESAIMEEAAA